MGRSRDVAEGDASETDDMPLIVVLEGSAAKSATRSAVEATASSEPVARSVEV